VQLLPQFMLQIQIVHGPCRPRLSKRPKKVSEATIPFCYYLCSFMKCDLSLSNQPHHRSLSVLSFRLASSRNNWSNLFHYIRNTFCAVSARERPLRAVGKQEVKVTLYLACLIPSILCSRWILIGAHGIIRRSETPDRWYLFSAVLIKKGFWSPYPGAF